MFDFNYLQELLMISIILSTITCTFIQKTKFLLKSSKYISLYSLIVNILLGIIFAYTFTTIKLPSSIWIGIFSFVGADSIYKTLEGKLSSYTEIRNKRNKKSTTFVDKKSNLI